MNRRNFMDLVAVTSRVVISAPLPCFFGSNHEATIHAHLDYEKLDFSADLVIAGSGSPAGCSAALATLRNNLKVIVTEEMDWIGGQSHSEACLRMNTPQYKPLELSQVIVISVMLLVNYASTLPLIKSAKNCKILMSILNLSLTNCLKKCNRIDDLS